ncbi:MAG: hypothetical protein ACI808_000598 [Paraglaciecola sp.]|jgi:hypothetical protein
MRNQTRFLLLYLCVLGVLVGTATQLAQAQDTNQSQPLRQNDTAFEAIEAEQLNQAELDQMLAPIALYPDTLLSHILVASTYPLEVIQAARWRAENELMDEQQALDAVEDEDWDPSVKALVPFSELLQKFSQDLDWLQALGDAFLLNEEQVLSSVQTLRQKAYALGNLENNDYVEVSTGDDQIIIESVEKEVVYVPYYDTRVVYGDWWWGAYPPYYWHHPAHYVLSAGFYWSTSFYIRPSFYFGGFHWGNRHVVANYHYHNNAHNYPHGRVVSVREYPRWNHNPVHRRGVRYDHQQNLNRFVSSGQKQGGKKHHQIDKQRVLNVEHLNNKGQRSKQNVVINKKNVNHQQARNEPIKKRLKDQRYVSNARNKTNYKGDRDKVNNKQRLVNASANQQRSKVVDNNQARQKVHGNKSIQNTQKSAAAKQTRQVQNKSNSNSGKAKTYSSNSNSGSKSRGNSNSQRQSSSRTQKSRPSKASHGKHKR